jgi:hypothetical protein
MYKYRARVGRYSYVNISTSWDPPSGKKTAVVKRFVDRLTQINSELNSLSHIQSSSLAFPTEHTVIPGCETERSHSFLECFPYVLVALFWSPYVCPEPVLVKRCIYFTKTGSGRGKC